MQGTTAPVVQLLTDLSQRPLVSLTVKFDDKFRIIFNNVNQFFFQVIYFHVYQQKEKLVKINRLENVHIGILYIVFVHCFCIKISRFTVVFMRFHALNQFCITP